MIYAYLLIAPGGILINYKFFSLEKQPEDKIMLVASGMYALYQFFQEAFDDKLHEIILSKLKTVVAVKNNILLALISDIDDNTSKIIANKYISKIVERLEKEKAIFWGNTQQVISKIRDILNEMDHEILQLSKTKVSYI